MTDNQAKRKNKMYFGEYLSTGVVDKCVNSEKLAAYGVCRPYLDDFYIVNYKNWIKNNFNAEMGWMEKNLAVRRDLRTRFPQAQSVIVVADNYYLNKPRKKNTLKISRYAWGDDYHQVLLKKLKRIIQELKKHEPTIDAFPYVDTGPVLEKALAIEAGVGWMGKNSCIIVPDFGSFCFLGVIIINKKIRTEFPKIEPKCGTCTNCMRSCPTGALEKPYVLNANKCLSYFSIEKKGDFTVQEQDWLQDWLYGCDICQEVCPWNKKWAGTTREISYFNRIEMLERSPREWMDLTAEEFGKLFQKNVFKRLKFDRFRRNLLTAVKNL